MPPAFGVVRTASLSRHQDETVLVIQIDQGWVAATAQTDCRAPTHLSAATGPLPADTTTSLRNLLAG